MAKVMQARKKLTIQLFNNNIKNYCLWKKIAIKSLEMKKDLFLININKSEMEF
jgi:hypothetical protein